MGRAQKILTIALWGLMVVAMIAFVGSGAFRGRRGRAQTNASPTNAPTQLMLEDAPTTRPGDLPVLATLPSFKLVDQDGKPFTDEQLRGRPWVGCFVFTHCASACPMMFAKMASLQKAVGDADVKLVSFTVDPERDTPEVLKAKGAELGAEPGRWFLLTGEKDAIFGVARGMLVAVQEAKG